MPSKSRLVYWDSCVFLHAIQQTLKHRAVLTSILDDAKDGKLLIVTSYLTIVEVRHLKNFDPIQLANDVAKINAFFDNDYIHLVNLDRQIARQASAIALTNSLCTYDAVQVATALVAKCSCLQTYDPKVLGCSGKIGHPPLTIEEPRSFSPASPLIT